MNVTQCNIFITFIPCSAKIERFKARRDWLPPVQCSSKGAEELKMPLYFALVLFTVASKGRKRGKAPPAARVRELKRQEGKSFVHCHTPTSCPTPPLATLQQPAFCFNCLTCCDSRQCSSRRHCLCLWQSLPLLVRSKSVISCWCDAGHDFEEARCFVLDWTFSCSCWMFDQLWSWGPMCSALQHGWGDLSQVLLAPTGALTVIVCCYTSGHFLRLQAFLPIYDLNDLKDLSCFPFVRAYLWSFSGHV